MNVVIKEVIGSRCIVKEDGQIVFDKINKSLKSGENVTLDFTGVNQFASPFFNFAIGKLLEIIDCQKLRTLLHIENINSVGEGVVKLVFENAPKYYGNNDYRKIVDEILAQQVEGVD